MQQANASAQGSASGVNAQSGVRQANAPSATQANGSAQQSAASTGLAGSHALNTHDPSLSPAQTTSAASSSTGQAGFNANGQSQGAANQANATAGSSGQTDFSTGSQSQASASLANWAASSNGTGSRQSASNTSVLIRTAPPNANLPTSALFKTNPNSSANYLVETDPAFTNQKQWLSSDYMLQALNQDPNVIEKRLGDGFYEQRLINEQVAQLTGRRFLGNHTSDEQQYAALMNAGVTFASRFNLRPGVALSAAQIAQLTSDIVWLVTQEVTLPDGTVTQALVPQVYATVRPGDLDGSGALFSADTVALDLTGDLNNSGTIAGRKVTQINADNIRNLGGNISGDNLALNASQDLDNIGGTISGVSAAVVTAGRDLNFKTTTVDSGGAAGVSQVQATAIDRVAGLYVSDSAGVLVAAAGRDINLNAALVQSAGSATLTAGRDLNANTVRTASSTQIDFDSRNFLHSSETAEVGSTIQASGDLSLSAAQDVNLRAATVQSDAALTVNAARELNITAGQSTLNNDSASFSRSSGLFSSSTSQSRNTVHRVDAVSSELGGQTVTLTSGADTTIAGSQVIADQDLNIRAGGQVTVTTVDTQYKRSDFQRTTESGLFAGGMLWGNTAQSTDQRANGATVVGATVGSVGGDVNINAGKAYTQTGSDVVAASAGADVNVNAQSIAITEAREREQTYFEQKTSQSGISVGVGSPLISAAQTTAGLSNAIQNTSSDRMKALGAAAAGLNIANNARDIAAAADALKSGNLAGVASVTVSIGSSRSHSLQTTQSDAGKASSLSAGGDVSLSARGAGADSNILVQGSDINAGGNATLQADNAVTLQAAQDRFSEQSSQSSSGASLGVSYGAGGWGVSASANRSGGNGNGDATTQQNTHVSAGNTLTVQSGGDTSLNGAVAQAERVVAEVGGDLNISSQQDTATYRAKSASSGGSLAFGGGQAGGSISGGQTAINSDYASVNETSALRAGDGGFDVQVKGDTTLSGGQITSTEAAVKSGANRFETGGQVAMVDVNNTSEYKADGASISIGAGSLKGASAGIGSDSGNAASVTTSGISGIAGNTAVRTGDAESGIANTFDRTQVQNEVDAQVQITAAFGQQASRAVGDYAATQMEQATKLLQQANETTDPAQQDLLKQQAQALINDWGDNGSKRVALHAIIGGLTGGAAGAAGATAGTLSAPAIAEALQSKGLDPQSALGQTLTGLASTAAGIASGSTVGRAAALNEAANNFLYHFKGKIVAYDNNDNDKVIELSESDLRQMAAQEPELFMKIVAGLDTDKAPTLVNAQHAAQLNASQTFDLNDPADRDALIQETDMGYINPNNASVMFQNGVANSPEQAFASALRIQESIGQPVGVINNGSDGLVEDIGEYLPDTLALKDVLNEYTYRSLNAQGKPMLIISHSAGNEDVVKALNVGALYNHQYPNLSLLSLGSPVGDSTLANAAGRAGVGYLGQVNDWRDPVTYSKLFLATLATSGAVGAVGAVGAGQSVLAGASAGPAGWIALGGGAITAGALGLGAAGVKNYHPITNYIQKPETIQLIKAWKDKQSTK